MIEHTIKYAVRGGLWLALALAMFGSLTHVAWAFSTLHGGDLRLGYVQAVAVDVGLAALAVGIQQRRKAGRAAWRLWSGVVLFALISTYANLLHGMAHTEAVQLIDAPAWLLILRPWLLSAILPTLVIWLAEIVSEDDPDKPTPPLPPLTAPSLLTDNGREHELVGLNTRTLEGKE
jgi:hypothetical protein